MSNCEIVIKGNMNGSSMGDEWNDVDEANAAYVEYFVERIEKAFKDRGYTNVDIDITARPWEIDHISFNAYGYDDDWSEEHAAEEIYNAEQAEAWGDFCGEAEERGL